MKSYQKVEKTRHAQRMTERALTELDASFDTWLDRLGRKKDDVFNEDVTLDVENDPEATNKIILAFKAEGWDAKVELRDKQTISTATHTVKVVYPFD